MYKMVMVMKATMLVSLELGKGGRSRKMIMIEVLIRRCKGRELGCRRYRKGNEMVDEEFWQDRARVL